MKLTPKLILMTAGIVLALILAFSAGSAASMLSNRAPAAAAPARAAVAAEPTARPGSLMDAPLVRNRFPNATLSVSEKDAHVGQPFEIRGAGYAPGSTLDLVWGTVDGSFRSGDQSEFYNYSFVEKTAPIARVTADGEGKFAYSWRVPEDFGGVHNIYVLAGNQKVMQAGITVHTEYTVSPLAGPSGTPIHIKITGIGYAKWDEVRSIGYDDRYTGFVNAMLTKGTGSATIRATGGVGKHVIRIGTWIVPYLNIDQAPNYAPGLVQEFVFDVTSADPEPGSTEPQTEWPAHSYGELQAVPGLAGPNGERLAVTPNVGTVGTPLKVTASGFPPNTALDLKWEAIRGNRLQGWNPKQFPLDKIATGADGNAEREVPMPDDLGGGHALVAFMGDKKIADARVVLEPSFLQMTPRSGPAGTDVTIELKGVGWTEVDNIYAVTYDNGLMGYACGFNSAGDVTIHTRVTGEPGWHYIDFWPTVYLGHIEPPWLPIMPWLSLNSHPGLPKPAFHLAFQITG